MDCGIKICETSAYGAYIRYIWMSVNYDMENSNSVLNITLRKESDDQIIVIIKQNNSGSCKRNGNPHRLIFDTEDIKATNNESWATSKHLVPTGSYPVTDDKFIHLTNNGIGFESKECDGGDNENICKATNDNIRMTLCIELQSFPLSRWPNWLKSFVSTTRRLVILRVAEQLNLTELHFQPRAVFFILNVLSSRMLESQTDLDHRVMIPMTQWGHVDISKLTQESVCLNVPLMRRILEEHGHDAVQYILRLFTSTGYTELRLAVILCAAIGHIELFNVLLKWDGPLKPSEKAFWVCLQLAAKGDHPMIARSLIQSVGHKKMIVRYYKATTRHKSSTKGTTITPNGDVPSPDTDDHNHNICDGYPLNRNTDSKPKAEQVNIPDNPSDDFQMKTFQNVCKLLGHSDKKFGNCNKKNQMKDVARELLDVVHFLRGSWSSWHDRDMQMICHQTETPTKDPGDARRPSSWITDVSFEEHTEIFN